MKNLLWVDLEMTGLDEKVDSILEVAAIVTDVEFKVIETLHHIVFQPREILENMNAWSKEHHGKSGLTQAVPQGTALAQVETDLLALIERSFLVDERIVLAGNSIGNDRRFIDKYLPRVAARLHYRMIDVSSFKEIFRERYGVGFQKGNSHRAVDDILESIRELAHYLSFVQVPGKSDPGSTQ